MIESDTNYRMETIIFSVTFVITFINLLIADFQVPQGGFEGRVINIYINIQ
jgi:hypothetical protein